VLLGIMPVVADSPVRCWRPSESDVRTLGEHPQMRRGLWTRRLGGASVLRAGRPSGPASGHWSGALQEVLMRALSTVRSAPTSAVVHLQVVQAGREAGMITAAAKLSTLG
jgi:hypothetical protein